jgi:hypothetical protein
MSENRTYDTNSAFRFDDCVSSLTEFFVVDVASGIGLLSKVYTSVISSGESIFSNQMKSWRNACSYIAHDKIKSSPSGSDAYDLDAPTSELGNIDSNRAS